MDEAIKIGQWTAPILMTGILGVIYSYTMRDDGTCCVSNRFKNTIALLLGVALAYIALLLKWDAGGYELTITDCILAFFQGIMLGATAVGLWKTFNIQIRNRP